MDIRQPFKIFIHRSRHIGIPVHRIDDVYISALRDRLERQADVLEAAAETLATMRRDDDQTFPGVCSEAGQAREAG
jgi:hypothetical protein